jgi:hypothetical protein
MCGLTCDIQASTPLRKVEYVVYIALKMFCAFLEVQGQQCSEFSQIDQITTSVILAVLK